MLTNELVGQIDSLVQQWVEVDRLLRSSFQFGWPQISARAGVERGFYVQVGHLAGRDGLDPDVEDYEKIGRELYKQRYS